MSTANLPIDTSSPETRLLLKILRLQVLTPLSVLINIAATLICGLVVKPSLKDISKAFPTAVSPKPVMIALLWMIIFVLLIFYCAMLVIGRKPETRQALANGVGLRLVFANWVMTAWVIVFSLKLWLPSLVLVSILLVLVAWINISLLFYPNASSRPFDFLAIHTPLRLFLAVLLLSSLPQAIFITLNWVYSPDHPERDYNERSWEAFAFIMGTNVIGLVWTTLRRDLVWCCAGVWIMLSVMSERPKPVPVFAATIMCAVLYPLLFIVGVAWNRLREKDREGVIALPPDDPAEREALARERDASALENGDGAAQTWAERN